MPASIQEGDTALHIAARMGNVDVVELLLEKGVNPNAKNVRQNPC